MFCFKQKTAYEMRISDGRSDVCSSDLPARPRPGELGLPADPQRRPRGQRRVAGPARALCRPFRSAAPAVRAPGRQPRRRHILAPRPAEPMETGSASRRESVCQNLSISVVAVSLKKKVKYTSEE